jgi:hypothetical protein
MWPGSISIFEETVASLFRVEMNPKLEVGDSFETSVAFEQTKWHHNINCCETFFSHILCNSS